MNAVYSVKQFTYKNYNPYNPDTDYFLISLVDETGSYLLNSGHHYETEREAEEWLAYWIWNS